MPSVHVSGSEILEIMSENFSYIQHKIGETAWPDGIISSGAHQPIRFGSEPAKVRNLEFLL